jgi:uncharacterized protein (UPF0332 family)
MKMSLEEHFQKYEALGLLKKENIGLDQVKTYLNNASKNLKNARPILEIDTESGFDSAYKSILKSGRALIFLYGYRPDDGQQHKTTIDLIRLILKDYSDETIMNIDKMRKKRNQLMYAPAPGISEQEAEKFIKTAEYFLGAVNDFLDDKNPQLKLF